MTQESSTKNALEPQPHGVFERWLMRSPPKSKKMKILLEWLGFKFSYEVEVESGK